MIYCFYFKPSTHRIPSSSALWANMGPAIQSPMANTLLVVGDAMGLLVVVVVGGNVLRMKNGVVLCSDTV